MIGTEDEGAGGKAGESEPGFAGHHHGREASRDRKCRPASLARAVVGAHGGGDAKPSPQRKRDKRSQDAAVVVDQQQCGAVAAGRSGVRTVVAARCWQALVACVVIPWARSTPLVSCCADRRSFQHLVGMSRSNIARRKLGTVFTPDGRYPQWREFDCGRSAGPRVCPPASTSPWVKSAAARFVVSRFFLHNDITFIEQVLEHPPKRLLGDAQHVEEISDLEAGIAMDEMHHR